MTHIPDSVIAVKVKLAGKLIDSALDRRDSADFYCLTGARRTLLAELVDRTLTEMRNAPRGKLR